MFTVYCLQILTNDNEQNVFAVKTPRPVFQKVANIQRL
jgi:hypothetical protein